MKYKKDKNMTKDTTYSGNGGNKKKKKQTLKEAILEKKAQTYIDTGFNASETIRRIDKEKKHTPEGIHTTAHRMLSNVQFQEKVKELLLTELPINQANNVLISKIKDTASDGTEVKALKMYYDLLDSFPTKTQKHVNENLNINVSASLDEVIKAIRGDIKENNTK